MNELKEKILDTPENRWCEIYKITCTINKKIYVGQAVSHILNHKRYRPYGTNGRFRSHLSEAQSKKKKQCSYLNNAIRLYGPENFVVETLETCSVEQANEREVLYIKNLVSMHPNGYNLTNGGKQIQMTLADRQRTSVGVAKYYANKRKDKLFQLVSALDSIEDNAEKYMHCLGRKVDGVYVQYGWYLLIKSKFKFDFGGVHIPLEESKKSCLEFFSEIKRLLQQKSQSNGETSKMLETS